MSDTITFCSYCHKIIYIANGGESALKRHAGVAPFSDKGKIHKLKTPVATSNNLKKHVVETVEVSGTEGKVQSPTSSKFEVR